MNNGPSELPIPPRAPLPPPPRPPQQAPGPYDSIAPGAPNPPGAPIAPAGRSRKRSPLPWIIGGAALLAAAMVVAAILVVPKLFAGLNGPGAAPKNMLTGGATFVSESEVLRTPALQPDEPRPPREPDWSRPPVDVTIYYDYLCPACGSLWQQEGMMLETYLGAGDITLNLYPVNMLDESSMGSNYSTRAANVFACTVDRYPDAALSLHRLLLGAALQPSEGTTGLTDGELLATAEIAGATLDDDFTRCVEEQRFAEFIDGNYTTVTEHGLDDLAQGAQLVNDPRVGDLQAAGGRQRLRSAPTVIVNGEQWFPGRDGSLEDRLLQAERAREARGVVGQGQAGRFPCR